MLLEYINQAMANATYDKLEDGSFFGKILSVQELLPLGKLFINASKS